MSTSCHHRPSWRLRTPRNSWQRVITDVECCFQWSTLLWIWYNGSAAKTGPAGRKTTGQRWRNWEGVSTVWPEDISPHVPLANCQTCGATKDDWSCTVPPLPASACDPYFICIYPPATLYNDCLVCTLHMYLFDTTCFAAFHEYSFIWNLSSTKQNGLRPVHGPFILSLQQKVIFKLYNLI
jgi:hypothetical protein